MILYWSKIRYWQAQPRCNPIDLMIFNFARVEAFSFLFLITGGLLYEGRRLCGLQFFPAHSFPFQKSIRYLFPEEPVYVQSYADF